MVSPWREQLKPGTYKGAPFYLESHEFEGGRRIVDHVFPYVDAAYTEDLGLKQRVYDLNVYILGEDYFGSRDNLISALESPGPGVLVHPYLGEKNVDCESFTVNETKADGGYVSISITFRETARKPSTESFADPKYALDKSVQNLNEHMVRDFKGFDLSRLSELGLSRFVNLVNGATDKILATANSFPGNFGVAELGYSIGALKGSIRELIRTPLILAQTTAEAIGGLVSVIGFQGLNPFDDTAPDAEQEVVVQGRLQRDALRPLITPAPSTVPPGDTPAREQEREAERLMNNLVRGVALGQLAIISARTPYATLSEALLQRNFIVSEIELMLRDPRISDQSYEALMDLLSDTVRAIPGPQSEESRITNVELYQTMPSLVVAYDIYGTLALEQDLILRNRIQNPAFVPQGMIEVISGS